MGYLQCDLGGLHQNIAALKLFLKTPQFEVETRHFGMVDGDDLALLFPNEKPNKPHIVALSGRADLVDGDVLYEFKASTSPVCDSRWVIQALLYAIMLPTPFKTLVVVNIHLGVLYKWELAELPELDALVQEWIAPHFRWHAVELAAFRSRRE
jgi:hypothetical protein